MAQMAGEFLVSEGDGTISRDAVLIDKGLKLEAGTVVAALSGANSSTSVSGATNTGGGAVSGAITLSAGALEGSYTATMTSSGATAAFKVTDPFGMLVGTGAVGSAFSAGGLAFTIASGSPVFVAGDYITIAVNIISGNYVAYDPTKGDGSQTTKGILFDSVDSTESDVLATIINNSAEVDASKLKWSAGVTTTGHKATAYAALAASGFKFR